MVRRNASIGRRRPRSRCRRWSDARRCGRAPGDAPAGRASHRPARDLGRERIGGMRGSFVDDHRQRRLDGMREIADMGSRALDDFAVGVDQRVGLARQRCDLDREIRPRAVRRGRSGYRRSIRNAFQRRQAEADLEQRGQRRARWSALRRCRRDSNRSCGFRRKISVASPATLTRNLPSAPRSTGRSTIRRFWPSGPST